jgi:hypothetical protein
VVRINQNHWCGFACMGCQNLICSLCFCYIWWALSFHSPWRLSFADLDCGSVAPLTWWMFESCHMTPHVFLGVLLLNSCGAGQHAVLLELVLWLGHSRPPELVLWDEKTSGRNLTVFLFHTIGMTWNLPQYLALLESHGNWQETFLSACPSMWWILAAVLHTS